MIVVEYEQIELDYCTECGGTWFDAGELDLLLQSIDIESGYNFLNDMLNAPEVKSTEKDRKCPVCNKKMKKSGAGSDKKVTIDICPEGHGMWFDGGELHQIIQQFVEKRSETDSAGLQIGTFLSKVFQAQQ